MVIIRIESFDKSLVLICKTVSNLSFSVHIRIEKFRNPKFHNIHTRKKSTYSPRISNSFNDIITVFFLFRFRVLIALMQLKSFRIRKFHSVPIIRSGSLAWTNWSFYVIISLFCSFRLISAERCSAKDVDAATITTTTNIRLVYR